MTTSSSSNGVREPMPQGSGGMASERAGLVGEQQPRESSSPDATTSTVTETLSLAPPARKSGHKIFIGLASLSSPGWLAYLPATTSYPYHPACTAFVLILWDTHSISYEIVEGCRNKPFERAGKTMSVDPHSPDDERVRLWREANPSHEVFEVGTTTRTPEEATAFHRAWRKNQLKYHSFWDNNCGFVEEFATHFANETQAWKINLVAPAILNNRAAVSSDNFTEVVEMRVDKDDQQVC
ncbi:hypothetical protein HK101_006399 [Irineochytrium annulatum]|nr:hypothetical protein HK101_006399 [Irineochytrium annulatum]